MQVEVTATHFELWTEEEFKNLIISLKVFDTNVICTQQSWSFRFWPWVDEAWLKSCASHKIVKVNLSSARLLSSFISYSYEEHAKTVKSRSKQDDMFPSISTPDNIRQLVEVYCTSSKLFQPIVNEYKKKKKTHGYSHKHSTLKRSICLHLHAPEYGCALVAVPEITTVALKHRATELSSQKTRLFAALFTTKAVLSPQLSKSRHLKKAGPNCEPLISTESTLNIRTRLKDISCTQNSSKTWVFPLINVRLYLNSSSLECYSGG